MISSVSSVVIPIIFTTEVTEEHRGSTMKFRRLSLGFLLLLALFIGVFAQQSGQPSVNRLQQIISYLASDALEGRRTGTPGANDAAHYIAGEFSLLGLRPAIQMARPARTRGENRAQFLQPFPYVASVELGKNNLIAFDPERGPDDLTGFTVGKDWRSEERRVGKECRSRWSP